MKNSAAINEICRQIQKACASIVELTMGMDFHEQLHQGLVDDYREFRFNDLERLQVLTLHLTDLMTSEYDPQKTDHADDGSTFGPGELSDVIGEDPEPSPIIANGNPAKMVTPPKIPTGHSS